MKLTIEKFNDVFCKIYCDKSIALELQTRFSFLVDGYRWHPLVKQGRWDGRKKLYNLNTRLIYTGLIPEIKKWADESEYELEIDSYYIPKNQITKKDAEEFISSLENLPFQPRHYQLSAFIDFINNGRGIVLSPTGSGKSFIQYLLARWYMKNDPNDILIIVPTTSLVYQLKKDFISYGMPNIDDIVHTIADGSQKYTDKKIVISTWQALQYIAQDKKLKNRQSQYDPKFFQRFGTLMGDECHTFKADSLVAITEAMTETKYRFGLSGTLTDSTCNKMVLQGLFGTIRQYVTTAELIENSTLSDFDIKVLMFHYSKEVKDAFKKAKPDYPTEIDFLTASPGRNNKIANLTISCKGNTIVLFRLVEKHGKPLFELIKSKLEKMGSKRNVYFYAGEVSGKDRDELREIIENEKDAIIVGSVATIATGINIINLNNLIFAMPQRGKIKVLQAIGRVLRKNGVKATLFDIADDIRVGKKENYSFKHYKARLEMYVAEDFNYKIIDVP